MNQKITAKKLAISMAILAAVFVFASCSKQQPKPQDNPQNNDQNQGQNQNNQQQNQEVQTEKVLVWYEIPELGIKFKVSEEAKEELRYVHKKDEDSKYGRAVFYYQGAYEIDNQCNGYDLGVAALAKIEGNASESENMFIKGSLEGGDVKQMDGYFLLHSGPGAPCIFDAEKRREFFDSHPGLEAEIFGSYLDTIEEM